jgi:hypothetical protein
LPIRFGHDQAGQILPRRKVERLAQHGFGDGDRFDLPTRRPGDEVASGDGVAQRTLDRIERTRLVDPHDRPPGQERRVGWLDA